MTFNQTSGSVIALHNIYLITGFQKYNLGAKIKLDTIISNQNKEGWYPEYGGPDLGYFSLAIDYLSKYYNKNQTNVTLFNSLDKAINFMKDFIHPDGSYGGEYGTRNTEYIYPDGLELLANKIKPARLILKSFYSSIKENKIINPACVDDRYFSFMIPNYLQALIHSIEWEYSIEKEANFIKIYNNAGIYIRREKK